MEFKDFNKTEIIKTLHKYLQQRLISQQQEAQTLLSESTAENRVFFERLQQSHGQITKSQLQALNSYAIAPHKSNQPIKEGALVYLSLQLIPEPASFHYWLLLPNVALYGEIIFQWKTYPIRVCDGSIGLQSSVMDQPIGKRWSDWADTHFSQALEITLLDVL